MSKIFDILRTKLWTSNLGTIIRERREALDRRSPGTQLSGLSRQTLVGLEAGALSDLGFNRVAQVLVLGLDLNRRSA
ncbi:MAG: hypothetical protein IPM01_04320 [Burkholderiaceae bacterium]|nr:hypothetical protein [Burkholderiaceae bacterium]